MYFCPECDFESDGAGRCPQHHVSLVKADDDVSEEEIVTEESSEEEATLEEKIEKK